VKCFIHHEYLAAEMNEVDPLIISHMEKGEADRFDCSGYRWFAAKIGIEQHLDNDTEEDITKTYEANYLMIPIIIF
jgi:hypothetical protein